MNFGYYCCCSTLYVLVLKTNILYCQDNGSYFVFLCLLFKLGILYISILCEFILLSARTSQYMLSHDHIFGNIFASTVSTISHLTLEKIVSTVEFRATGNTNLHIKRSIMTEKYSFENEIARRNAPMRGFCLNQNMPSASPTSSS